MSASNLQTPPTTHSRSAQICRELLVLSREEARLRRIAITHERCLEAIDWTAMTRGEQLRITRHGQTIEHQLQCVGQAIDQRIFELVHADDECLGPPLPDRFDEAVSAIATATIGETGGASYELYARRFTDACEPLIDGLDPAVKEAGRAIAVHYGYLDAEHAGEGHFGPGTCTFSGIDADFCHCGRHP